MEVFRPYYLQQPQIRFCPTSTKPDPRGGRFAYVAWGPNFHQEYGSYGINLYVTDPMPGKEGGKPASYYWRQRDVREAAEIPMFVDDRWWDTHRTTLTSHNMRTVRGLTTNAMKMICPFGTGLSTGFGLLHPPDRSEGAMDVTLASGIPDTRPLDQGRRRPGPGLARMDERVQGLLTSKQSRKGIVGGVGAVDQRPERG
jgi:hypothetical protein